MLKVALKTRGRNTTDYRNHDVELARVPFVGELVSVEALEGRFLVERVVHTPLAAACAAEVYTVEDRM
jgi:hypothetical protein